MLVLTPLLFVHAGCSPSPEQEGGADTTTDVPEDTGPVVGCPEGQLLDDVGECVPEACGSSISGSAGVDDATVFVDGSGASQGDGTQAAPLSSLQAGVDLAAERGGGLVAVAAGVYVENLALNAAHGGVEIAGRCPELVVVDGSGGEKDESAVTVAGSEWVRPEVELRGLAITGGPYGGLWVEDATVAAAGLIVESNTRYGVFARGSDATLSLSDCQVLATLSSPDETQGRGIYGIDGPSIVVESCTVQGNRDVGVIAIGVGTRIDLLDTVVEGTLARPDGEGGRGISAEGGATLTAQDCVISSNIEFGARVADEGSTMSLASTFIEDTESNEAGAFGYGANALNGATLELTDCVLLRNRDAGLFGDEGATVTVDATRIADTRTSPDGTGGVGVFMGAGSELTLSDSEIVDNYQIGLTLRGGAVATLVDTTISGTMPTDLGDFGRGVNVQGGASLSATGSLVTGNHEIGLAVFDDDTSVVLSACEVSGGGVARASGAVSGVQVVGGAEVLLDEVVVTGHPGTGVVGSGPGTVVEVSDSLIGDIGGLAKRSMATGLLSQYQAAVQGEGLEVDGIAGPGLYATDADLDCVRCLVQGTAFAGALVSLDGVLRLQETVIEESAPQSNAGGGVGVFADGSRGPYTLELEGVSVRVSAYAALWLDGAGSAIVADSELEGGPGFEPWPGTWWHGDAVYARGSEDGAGGEASLELLLEDTLIQGSRHGLFLHGAAATLDGNTWTDNDVDVWQQRCDLVEALTEAELGAASTTSICPTGELPVADLSFDGFYLQDAVPYKE